MIRPMLAHKYDPSRITYPCFVQPKLNGIRGVYDPRPSPHFQSRYGERWSQSVVQHSLSPLTRLGNVFLDGEFYRHGMSLQEINSRIAVTRCAPHKESALISFHVFDVITRKPFRERALLLNRLSQEYAGCEGVAIVETREVFTSQEADFWYNQWKNLQGFEGIMYRLADATYGLESQCGNKENRWWCIQKRKERVDMDATIIGVEEMLDSETKEPKGTLGSFWFRADNEVVFSAGSGLTMVQRAKYWSDPDAVIGKRARIEYEMLSDGGKPLKPTIACVYE
jgi:ATP-dependent DNA ligase